MLWKFIFRISYGKRRYIKKKIDEEIKNKFDKYYNNKNGQLLSKENYQFQSLSFY